MQKTEVTDAHETVGQGMKEEAEDERILGGPDLLYRAAR